MTDEELIERAVSDIRAACQQYCVADCDCSDFAWELRSRWQSLTATESKLETLTHRYRSALERIIKAWDGDSESMHNDPAVIAREALSDE